MELDQTIIDALLPVSTATITSVLARKGLNSVWMRDIRPIVANQPRVVGRAFTLRFIPAREDLSAAAFWTSPRSARAAVEEIPEASIAVVAAGGVTHAGIFGDIFCARMKARGVAALVTDGALRDVAGRGGDRASCLVPRRRTTAFDDRPHLRQLAGTSRLRRCRHYSWRHRCRRQRRRYRHSRRNSGRRGGARLRAGTTRKLDHGASQARVETTRPLST